MAHNKFLDGATPEANRKAKAKHVVVKRDAGGNSTAKQFKGGKS